MEEEWDGTWKGILASDTAEQGFVCGAWHPDDLVLVLFWHSGLAREQSAGNFVDS
jgi:hypothetical protein